MRVLLLNNVPAPYFDPLFETLAQKSGWELTVCYSANWNQDVGWKEKAPHFNEAHRTIILDQQNPGLKSLLGSAIAASATLFQMLLRERPQYLLIYGYTLLPQLTAILWAMISGTLFAVAGDANFYLDKATGWKRSIKTFWLRMVARRAAALICNGTANRLFWQSYGAQTEKLYEARFAVDNEYFAHLSEARKDDAIELQRRLGILNKIVFLFVGRLVKRKNVDLIIRATRQLDNERIAVVIAGSGEEREALEKLAADDPRIFFSGNVAQTELPLYYALADVLLLPAANEPWGLVVNEAMACGLAIIAHKHCGAAVDLVGSDNGIALESFSVNELAEAMKKVAGDAALLDLMQKRSREKIADWTIDSASQGIIMAVESSAYKRPVELSNTAR
ncbi:MAG: glycosyltransferase family 4 protein [Blastocatellales bacterium]